MKKLILDTELTRREFVGAVGGLLATSALPASATASVAAKKLGKIGVQLYTVRDEMKKNFEGTLARVAQIGYKEVETAGYFDHSAKSVRDTLRKNGLTSPAAHVGFPELGKSWDKVIDDALVILNLLPQQGGYFVRSHLSHNCESPGKAGSRACPSLLSGQAAR